MFYLAQAGSALQVLLTDGTIYQTLTLPSGVTIDASKRGRFAILGQQIVFVNAATVSLWIDPIDFTVRPMSIMPPPSAPTLAAGSGTGLTGAYRVKVSFCVKDEAGAILLETPLGPASAAVTLTNDSLNITNIPLSSDSSVNCRRLYRTVANGAIYFAMFDLDDNETTETTTAMLDAALEILPEDPELGNPPGAIPGTSMELITEWRNRLWGKSAAPSEVDEIRFSDFDRFYAWSRGNFLNATPKGEDAEGIVGFGRRRDEMVVMKRRRILKVTGFDETDFEVTQVIEGVGCIAPDSIVVVRDVVYWLGPNAVYAYGPDGVTTISADKVHPWFATGTYFNRDYFPIAVGGYNNLTDCYELQLAGANFSQLNAWVAYDIRRKEWLGPHITNKFTASMRALLQQESGVLRPVIASLSGYIYDENQAGAADTDAAGSSAIPISWQTKAFNGNAPGLMKFWGEIAVYLKAQGWGSKAITILPQIDPLLPAPQPIYCPQQAEYAELERPTHDASITCQLTFSHSVSGEDVELRGFELPFATTGRRPTGRFPS